VKVAKLATKVAEAQFQSFMRESIFSMLESLYGLKRLKNEYEILQEKSQLLDKLVFTLEKRIGSSTNQPLIQSRAKLAFEDVKVEIQKNKIDQIAEENKLKTFLTLDRNEEIHLSVEFKNKLDESFKHEELVENAKKVRPDFQALKILKEQLDGQIELERKRVWGDMDFQAGLTRQSRVDANPSDLDSSTFPTAWSWLVGLTIPIPAFDRNQGNIQQAKLRANQILIRERFMQEALSNEIETSIRKLKITDLNLNRYKTVQLTSAKTVRDSALRQFGTGSTTLIEYLDAVDAYHATINKYIEAQHGLTTEFLRLKLISGKEIGL
jgi:cobalt-zinc-cadmium efflux system outer membrane protein